MGVAAVEGLINGQNDVMVGIRNNEIVYNSFDTIMNNVTRLTMNTSHSKILSI